MQIDFSLKGEALLQQISQAIQKRLTFTDNIQSSIVDVPTTGAADIEFIVGHNLGKIPLGFIANLDRSGVVYVSNRGTWTPLQMSLKCSAANAVLKLIVF